MDTFKLISSSYNSLSYTNNKFGFTIDKVGNEYIVTIICNSSNLSEEVANLYKMIVEDINKNGLLTQTMKTINKINIPKERND